MTLLSLTDRTGLTEVTTLNWKAWPQRYWASFSYLGLVVGVLFFAASLSPSLLPRVFLVQGILSGLALAIGYGSGVFIVWLWRYFELPEFRDRGQRIAKWLLTGGVLIFAIVFLWRATVWQNSIRELMEMPPVETAFPLRVVLIATLFAAILIAAAGIFLKLCRIVEGGLNRLVPRRVSFVLSILAVGALLLFIANGVLAKSALRAADSFFLQLDKYVDEEIGQPADELATGSAQSLIPWDSIGRQGKDFIVGGPTREEISQFVNKQAIRPLRVYVGLRSTEDLEHSAKLALEELKRVGGFDRSVLVVATPTGTGWLDPGAVDTLEYLHAGDTAIVSMQYSYLPSWLTILVDSNLSRVAAQLLFEEVYDHWRQLPKDQRPKLYLHGLSLGSLGSETCADLFMLFEDPIQGAVWSGPPFPSTKWSNVTHDRNPDSPAWMPRFRDGTMVRFTGRENLIDETGDRWGPMRFVYVQHASDPMTFFSPQLVFRKPDWLIGQRGPDVSPFLDWYPIVTFLQIGCDLPMATSVPAGYGHNIAAANYIDAWIAVTQPPDWSEDDIERLKQEFAKREPAAPFD
jgi:uncharacterized membrane protein